MSTQQQELPTLIAAELANYRALAREASHEVGVKVLAAHLPPGTDGKPLSPKSVENQFRLWTPRNHPSADAGYVLRRLSSRHDEAVAKLMGRVVSPRPVLSPSESLRELQGRAAKGYVTAQEVAELLARTALPVEREEVAPPVPLRAAR